MEMDVISCLYDSSNSSESSETTNVSESVSPDDITGMLMHSFNEAEDSDGIDWGVTEETTEDEVDNGSEEEVQEETEETVDEEPEESEEESDVEQDNEYDDESDEYSENEELLGTYESIKDELDGERETLSDIYVRFFDEIVEPLFRKLEDSNINVAFDTTGLKSLGVIRIELSHRNSEASAEMEINIFGNTVNGEFLGMENSDGEAVATSLEDVSLDDLLNILIKILG